MVFENFIGGRWLAPRKNRYLLMPHQSSGVRACRVPRSSIEDVNLAVDQALVAKRSWSGLAAEERATAFSKIEDRIGDRWLALGLADCWDRGESAFAVSQRAADRVLETLTDPLYRQLVQFVSEDRNRPQGTQTSEVVKLALVADDEIDAVCRRIVPLLLEGHVAVAVLLYREGTRLPVRLLALLGSMAECLPAGVLNLITGLGLEAGVALVDCSRAVAESALTPRVVRPPAPSVTNPDRKRAT